MYPFLGERFCAHYSACWWRVGHRNSAWWTS